MVVWVIPRFCTQGHLYKSDIFHTSWLMSYDIFSKFMFSRFCHCYDIFGWLTISLKKHVFWHFQDISKLWHFCPVFHSLPKNVRTSESQRSCQVFATFGKIEKFEFWQIFGKNEHFYKNSCYDIFVSLSLTKKNLKSLSFCCLFLFLGSFLFSIWSWGGGLCQSFSAPGHVTVKKILDKKFSRPLTPNRNFEIPDLGFLGSFILKNKKILFLDVWKIWRVTHGARITSKTCRRFDILNEPNSLLSLSLSLLDQQEIFTISWELKTLKPTEFLKKKISKIVILFWQKKTLKEKIVLDEDVMNLEMIICDLQ